MRHEMLTQRAPFCIGVLAKKGTLSQQFVTHVVPPLLLPYGSECTQVGHLDMTKSVLIRPDFRE